MAVSGTEREFVTYIVDLMQSLGTVSAKRMFGGYGVFMDGRMFGLIADSVLYLKSDKASEGEFEEKGLEAFTYQKNEKTFRMSYFQAPEEALEEKNEMLIWATKAYEAALRTSKRPKTLKRNGRSKRISR